MVKKVGGWRVKIYTNWRRYKKLIPAVLGVTLLILLKYYEIEIPGLATIVLDWLVGAATVFGVYQVKNEPMPEAVVVETKVEKVGEKK